MVAFRFGVRGSTWGERRGPIWHARRGQPGVRWLAKVHPEGAPRLAVCHARATLESARASSRQTPPKEKFDVTNKSPVGDISAVTLIRTDTTLDHSQKAEKVCLGVRRSALRERTAGSPPSTSQVSLPMWGAGNLDARVVDVAGAGFTDFFLNRQYFPRDETENCW